MVQAKQTVKKIMLASDSPGHVELLLGNEAIARGAIEAGIQVATAYPGTPSTEILEGLSRVAKEAEIYTQWSTNEKVATEVAMSASMSGLRAITSMKAEGLNVALDFVVVINMTETGKGGLVIVVCDDPEAWSSGNEQDSRWEARSHEIPLLEPSSITEAKEMTKWAFELSEELRITVLVRSVTRISHSSAPVTFGEIKHLNRQAYFDPKQYFSPIPVTKNHIRRKQKMDKVRGMFETSPFNWYSGPDSPELTIVCSGTGWLYSLDAIEKLEIENSIGILKLGTTWPLPTEFIRSYLEPDSNILVVEEVDSFLETHLKEYLYTDWSNGALPKIYGKGTGHISSVGELNPNIVIGGITKLMGLDYRPREAEYEEKAAKYAKNTVQYRELTFCPGCPHRASFWTMKNVLRLDDTDSFVNGDIGCYVLDRLSSGTMMMRTHYVMGSGSGLASGFGKLNRFGFDQPVVAVCGDSTFFHAAMPAIVNAIHHSSNATFIVLDNGATAMTGFQPHPGTSTGAMGETVSPIDMEKVCRSFGCPVEVADPFNGEETEQKLSKLIEQEGTKVMIMRRKCELLAFRQDGPQYRVWVEEEECLGEECGCNRYCNRIFKCPALVWNEMAAKAYIDEAICTGCGFCVDICPRGAINRSSLVT